MILLKSLQEIAKMEVANRIVAEVLEGVKEKIQPGIETRELDELGEESEKARALMAVTEESLYAGIAQVKAGQRLSDISHAVQTVVEGAEFGVIREFVGHGIGRSLHEDPQIPNFGPPDRGPTLQVGMTIAIEPMTPMGSWKVRVL